MLYITCMKPELREAYDGRDDELKEREVIMDKEFINDLSETSDVQCIDLSETSNVQARGLRVWVCDQLFQVYKRLVKVDHQLY